MVAKVDALEEGSALVGRVRKEAIQTTERITEGLKSIQDQASEGVGKVAVALKKQARRAVKEQKKVAALKIRNAGSAVHKAAKWLEEGNTAPLAEYVEMAADSAEQAAKYLQDRSPEQIAKDLAKLVKRHPVAMFTGALMAGMAVGRLARAAGESSVRK